MGDKFIRLPFERMLNVESIISIFYMEFSKDFGYEGESHDFWEMVYIDKGEMICTADKNQFLLKSGELTFHKPNEYHNLSGNKSVAPNVSILTFECKSKAMEYFEGKILRLDAEEKQLLSMLFAEGLSCYRMVDEYDPLRLELVKLEDPPFGSSQMTKNLLEIFLIKLRRNKEVYTKQSRVNVKINGVPVPYEVKEILDHLEANVYGRLSISQVASAVGKSPSAVKKLFSQYMAEGIMHYYNTLKLTEAKKLIREGTCNFAQIADLLGFSTPQYFSKCFKDMVKMTPSEYKRAIMGQVRKDTAS